MPLPRQTHTRARWARTNHANGGFKDNTPGGWVDTSGPVWWYGSDRAWLTPGDIPAGRAAVTKASGIIVNRISAAQWRAGGETPRWIADPMLVRPDGRYPDPVWPASLRVPRSLFWGQWIRSAVHHGMGYLIFVEDAEGFPTPGTLGILRPEQVDTSNGGRTIGTSQWSGRVETSRDGRFTVRGDTFRLIELRNPTTPLDPDTGTTPGTLAYHAQELGLLDAQLGYAMGTFDGAGVPSGFLKVDMPELTPEQATALKQSWQAAHGSGSRSTAVLNATTTYQPIAVSPVDAALTDMRKLSLLDVANAFGVPPYMLGYAGPSNTYSNLEWELEALYQFTLLPWATAVEETLSALLPGTVTLDIQPTGERMSTGGDTSAVTPAE